MEKDKWDDLPDLRHPRDRHASVCLNGKLFVLGGHNTKSKDQNDDYSSVEMLDAETKVWSNKHAMPLSLMAPSAVVVNGQVFVIGGMSQGERSYESIKYSIQDDIWSHCEPIPLFDEFAVNSVVAVEHKIYILSYEDFYGV